MDLRVIELFEQISSIPRASGNEKGISDYLLAFAQKHGLGAKRDDHLNVIIEKAAAKGKESGTAIFIQAHMDMVCEKVPESSHDFERDGIKIVKDGDFLSAQGTSLGADNGIGMAILLRLLEEDFANPRIVAIFSADEERGLAGVKNLDLSDYSDISALINLDGEEEGIFWASCAGGIRSRVELGITPEPYHKEVDCVHYTIEVKGLSGGHSGLAIDQERANAILVLARILRRASGIFPLKLLDIIGGGKENSIPTTARATVSFKKAQVDKAQNLVTAVAQEIRHEYLATEKQIGISFDESDAKYDLCAKPDDIRRLTDLLLLMPNGLIKKDIVSGCAVASSNLGIISMEKGKMIASSMVRSNINSIKYEVCEQFSVLARLLSGKFCTGNDYPAWEYKSESKLREHLVAVYQNEFARLPKIQSVHGGLECAYLAEKIPGIDMVVIGCNIYDVHSIRERVSISSAMRVYKFLKSVVERYR